MTNIMIHGSYFAPNFGDVLLWRSTVERVRMLINGSHICHANMPKALQQLYINGFSDIFSVRGKKPDIVIFCGGGYLMPPRSMPRVWEFRNLIRHQSALRIARSASHVGLFGVGLANIGLIPFRRLLSRVMSSAELLVLRDVQSARALSYYGVPQEVAHVTPDLAFIHVHEKAKDYKTQGRYVGIHADFSGMAQDKVRLFIKSCEKIIGLLPLEVKFFVDCPSKSAFESISIVKQQIPSLSGAPVCVFDGSPERFLDGIGSCAAIVTTKLHVGICATAMAIPVLSIAKHIKTKRFYSQFGLSACCPESPRELTFYLERLDLDREVESAPKVVEAGIKALQLFDQFVSGAVR